MSVSRIRLTDEDTRHITQWWIEPINAELCCSCAFASWWRYCDYKNALVQNLRRKVLHSHGRLWARHLKCILASWYQVKHFESKPREKATTREEDLRAWRLNKFKEECLPVKMDGEYENSVGESEGEYEDSVASTRAF